MQIKILLDANFSISKSYDILLYIINAKAGKEI